MDTFVIRRRGIAASVTELEAALARLRAFEDRPGTHPVRWIRSYVLRERDDRFGLACVFEAHDAPALHRHALAVALAVEEIVPVFATVSVRPHAVTDVYLIRRRTFWNTALDLQHSAAITRRVNEELVGTVSWIRTYALREREGTLGAVCLYQGASPRALAEHAARGGIPADEITEVVGHVIYRDDPQTQAISGGLLPA